MSTASELVNRINAKLHDRQREFIRPMASLVVRFSGVTLSHAGKSAWAALSLALARAPESTRWRGFVGKRYAAPKPVTPAGLKPIQAVLGKLKKLPGDAVMLYVKDGTPDGLVPETFSAWLSLAKDHKNTFATQGGLLSVAVPLEQVDSLVELGDQLVEVLDAEVAWCGPSVWLAPHCLFNSSSNELPDNAKWLIELFGVDPQLDAPNLYASRWPFSADEVEPDVFSGFLAPSWTLWANAKLAKKVKDFPVERCTKTKSFTRYRLSDKAPFAMTEAIYAQWRAGWAALKPLHLKNEDESSTAKVFRARWSGASHASLLSDWRSEAETKAIARDKANNVLRELQQLADQRSPKLLELATKARGVVDAGSLCWWVLPALVEFVPAGKADVATAQVWLDYGEETGAWRSIGNRQQLTLDAAALATVCGDAARAFALIREAFDGARKVPKPFDSRLPKDPRFKALRKDAEWKKLVG